MHVLEDQTGQTGMQPGAPRAEKALALSMLLNVRLGADCPSLSVDILKHIMKDMRKIKQVCIGGCYRN